MGISEWTVVRNMALLRMVSSFIELVAAVSILHIGTVSAALRINALLGLVGPLILIAVTIVGVAGLAGSLNPVKLAMVIAGVLLVFAGTR